MGDAPVPGPKRMQKAGAHLSKAGSPRSPAMGGSSGAHSSRRQSMLILDLQSRKKNVLRQILKVRTELASMDEAEMREAATALGNSGGGEGGGAVKPLNLKAGGDVYDEQSTSPTFSPLAGETGGMESNHKPGSSAEAMYQNQRKYNKGLELLKNSSTMQLDEIKTLKHKLQNETEQAIQAQQNSTFINMLESPMQTAIYTVQETITALDQKENASQEDKDVADQLSTVLQTLSSANPYLPAFDFSRPECDMTSDTQNWLVNTFHHAGAVGTSSTAEGDEAAAGAAASTPASTEAAPLEAAPPGMELEALSSMSFDCFAFSEDQYVVGIESMFHASGVLGQFKVSNSVLRNFLLSVKQNYRNNTYHNFRHAFDVTQMAFALCANTVQGKTLQPLEKFSLMITAVCHDMDHGGKSNDFLINTSSPLALLYNGRGVNENHHCCCTFKLMRDAKLNMLGGLSGQEKRDARKMMISLFLATDMTQHFEIFNKFKTRVESDQFGKDTDAKAAGEDRQLLLDILLHASDLSNPARPFNLASKWGTAICEEFFQQGEMEKRMGVPVSPMCSRPEVGNTLQGISGSQIGFGDFVIAPFFGALVKGLDSGSETGIVSQCVEHLKLNRAHWVGLKDGTETA